MSGEFENATSILALFYQQTAPFNFHQCQFFNNERDWWLVELGWGGEGI